MGAVAVAAGAVAVAAGAVRGADAAGLCGARTPALAAPGSAVVCRCHCACLPLSNKASSLGRAAMTKVGFLFHQLP